MISSFGIVSEVGLGQLHATTGLAVAILTLVPYNYFRTRADLMTDGIEERATRLELLFE